MSLAEQHDFADLCSVAGDGNCADDLDAAGRDAAPASPPTVVATGEIPSSNSNGQQTVGGIVLSVCGIGGHGQAYRSQVLVFRNRSSLAAINPVYWDGISIGGSPAETVSSPGAAQPPC